MYVECTVCLEFGNQMVIAIPDKKTFLRLLNNHKEFPCCEAHSYMKRSTFIHSKRFC